MGVLGIVAIAVGVLVVGGGATGVVLYNKDFRVDATVQQTRCGQGEVDVRTKMFGIDHTVSGLQPQQCGALSEGNFVEYRVKSKHTTIYEVEGGKCLYDSITGFGCGRSTPLPL